MEPKRGQVGSRHNLSVDATPTGRPGSGLLGRRVVDLAKAPPLTCAPTLAIAAAAALMSARGAGSIVVVGRDGSPLGIMTDRDIRSRVVAQGIPATAEVSQAMSSPLLSVPAETPAIEALLEMTRLGVHHLGILEAGRLIAVVSSHDMVLAEGAHPLALARGIDAEASLDGLAASASRFTEVVRWLVAGGSSASVVGRLITELNDRLVRRALELVLDGLEAQGHGRPPLPFAWLAAGSEGRREQTLRTDQDNGLVYADPPPALRATAADYFARVAGSMGKALTRLGFPPCQGGFMASNPPWCQPDSAWRGYFTGWMEAQEPQQVLQASVFFDLRPVAGAESVGRALWEWVCERAPSQRLFLGYMAKAALERQVPLGLFGGFVVERSGAHQDSLDLKMRGMFPVTQAARACALSLGLRETNTLDRLLAAGRAGLLSVPEVDDLRDAYEVIARLRLAHQMACLDAGAPPDNFVNPRALGKADRLLLKEAFKTVAWLQRWIEDRFQTDLIG